MKVFTELRLNYLYFIRTKSMLLAAFDDRTMCNITQSMLLHKVYLNFNDCYLMLGLSEDASLKFYAKYYMRSATTGMKWTTVSKTPTSI